MSSPKPIRMIDAPPAISDAESMRRQEAVRYARASVRFEGFVLDEEAEVLNRSYIDGALTSEQHASAIRRLAGL